MSAATYVELGIVVDRLGDPRIGDLRELGGVEAADEAHAVAIAHFRRFLR